jgi:hypothetical protein
MTKPSKTTKRRKCFRCGCTDKHACAGGCSWVSYRIDLCSACATPVEIEILEELESNLTAVHNDAFAARDDGEHARLQMRLFIKLLKSKP